MSELLERHRRVIPNWVALYYDEPLELVSGSGSRVTDAAGHTYLDFFCGILTNMLGYDVPEVARPSSASWPPASCTPRRCT